MNGKDFMEFYLRASANEKFEQLSRDAAKALNMGLKEFLPKSGLKSEDVEIAGNIMLDLFVQDLRFQFLDVYVNDWSLDLDEYENGDASNNGSKPKGNKGKPKKKTSAEKKPEINDEDERIV